jgi:LysR family hydrogen peroxide-inducible transcriptional activator
MISIKQLTYALAVENTLHFKKAAEQCHVSQSALSTAITALETQLDLKIFERDNKKVLVTPIGRDVLEKAKSILLQVDDLQQLADSQKKPLSFPITLGLIPTIAPYLLPKILPILTENYPQARVSVIEDQSHVLVDKVRQGEIDTAILALPFPCDGLLAREFWQEDFYWVTLKGNEHSEQQEVTSHEVTESKLMLLKEGHCLKDHILDVCSFSEQAANHSFGATSLNTLIQMVLGNLGTTLIPEMAKEQLLLGNQQLSAIHLNEPGPHRRIAFIFRPNYTRFSSIEALESVCKKALESSQALLKK